PAHNRERRRRRPGRRRGPGRVDNPDRPTGDYRHRRPAGPVRLGPGGAVTRPLKIMLVAAEPSGDSLGAGLAAALRNRLGDDVTFVGIGGARLAEQGMV